MGKSKYAHFEKYEPADLVELYKRHAEVARDIHQDSLREFTGNSDLEVELIPMSPLDATPEVLKKMTEYDVVSVSLGYTMPAARYDAELYDKKLAESVQNFFELNDMPVYVVAASNDGLSFNTRQARLADFGRNSLVVGEANFTDIDGYGNAYVEEHSSKNNPTLACDSPFNRGEEYQYINLAPDLTGHEGLIREWLVEREYWTQCDAADVSELTLSDIRKLYGEIYDDIWDNYAYSQVVNDKIAAFMDNPQSLHDVMISLVAKDIRENDLGTVVDEKTGMVAGMNGTSFSGPEQAGYVSGAMYEQEQREDQGLPILTKDEITTLVKMATFDTRARENTGEYQDTYTNEGGNTFTEIGGNGVFSPEMFRNLLDKAYETIGTDPDINRGVVELKMNAAVERSSVGVSGAVVLPEDWEYNTYVAHPTFPEGDKILIDRAHYYLDIVGLKGVKPDAMILQREGARALSVPMQMASKSRIGDMDSDHLHWLRSERQFGETLKSGEEWRIGLPGDYDVEATTAKIAIYGYHKGGFMDKMMEHAQKVAPDYTPKSDSEPKNMYESDPDLEKVPEPESDITPPHETLETEGVVVVPILGGFNA